MGWGRKWFVEFNAGKTRLFLFDRSNNTGAKMLTYNLLRCWGCLSLPNGIVALTLSLLLKLPSRKVEPFYDLFYEVSFS